MMCVVALSLACQIFRHYLLIWLFVVEVIRCTVSNFVFGIVCLRNTPLQHLRPDRLRRLSSNPNIFLSGKQRGPTASKCRHARHTLPPEATVARAASEG